MPHDEEGLPFLQLVLPAQLLMSEGHRATPVACRGAGRPICRSPRPVKERLTLRLGGWIVPSFTARGVPRRARPVGIWGIAAALAATAAPGIAATAAFSAAFTHNELHFTVGLKVTWITEGSRRHPTGSPEFLCSLMFCPSATKLRPHLAKDLVAEQHAVDHGTAPDAFPKMRLHLEGLVTGALFVHQEASPVIGDVAPFPHCNAVSLIPCFHLVNFLSFRVSVLRARKIQEATVPSETFMAVAISP